MATPTGTAPTDHGPALGYPDVLGSWGSLGLSSGGIEDLGAAMGIGGASGVSGAANAASQSVSTLLGSVENWFLRGGLIIVGAIIVLVALWQLLQPITKGAIQNA